MQRGDGSWANPENLVKEDDPLIATAFALRALLVEQPRRIATATPRKQLSVAVHATGCVSLGRHRKYRWRGEDAGDGDRGGAAG
jgi:hypothetical protein